MDLRRKNSIRTLSRSQPRPLPDPSSRRSRQTAGSLARSLQTDPDQSQSARDDGPLTRELNGCIRALEGEGNERKFELSFSSEEPYNRGWCIEILDHAPGAVSLTRLNEIGVLLFNHDRDAVIGRIEQAWIEGDRGKATVVFDSDEDAEVIYQKVKSGTLKGVSVGYRVKTWEIVKLGETSSDGKHQGPCDIATSWEPYEISIVSVPADPTVGVGRSFSEADRRKQAPSMAERQLQINLNYLRRR